MGWTYTHRPKGETTVDFFIRRGVLRYPDDSPMTMRVLASAVVGMSEFYAAVETTHRDTGERHVWAAVILLRYCRGEYNFGWKDMDETMGPYQTNCPARILDLLTPTDSCNAIAWRTACRERLARKAAQPKIVPGRTVTLYGRDYRVLETLGRKGFRIVDDKSSVVYRLSHALARRVTAVA